MACSRLTKMVSPTKAELEVLKDYSFGLETKEIGARRGRSWSTVNNQIFRVMKKLNARNYIHAVSIAIRRGLI